MALRVELILFSGIRNPAWMLATEAAGSLVRFLTQLPPAIQRFDSLSIAFAVPQTGYRGFQVLGDGVEDVLSVRIWGTRVASNDATFVDQGRALEAWLFATAPLGIRVALGMTFAQLSTVPPANQPISGISGASAAVVCPASPAYPGASSVWDTYSSNNNCYNYANDVLFGSSNSCAMPGGLPTWADASEMRRAAEFDHLVWAGTSPPSACAGGTDAHLLAICLRPRAGTYQDFHCLRLDDSGVWSQKDGPSAVNQSDEAGSLITNISTAQFRHQMTLVGFFWSPPSRKLRQ